MLGHKELSVVVALIVGGCSGFESPRAQDVSGRFVNVWGATNLAELSSERAYSQSGVVTEILVPRQIGQLKQDGTDVFIVGLRMRVECDPVSYDFDRQTFYDANGEILSAEDTFGMPFEPEGPYSELARELCGRTFNDAVDFKSLTEFHQLASGRTRGAIEGSRPTIDPEGR